MLKIILSCFLAISFSAGLFAQGYDRTKVKKEAVELFDKSYQEAQSGQYAAALSYLEKAMAADPGYLDALMSKAAVNARLRRYDAAIKDYESAIAKDPVFTRNYIPAYANALAGAGKFEKALEQVNLFLTKKDIPANSRKSAEARKKNYEFAVQRGKTQSAYSVNARPLGPGVNTAGLEYYPSFSLDAKKLVFTRRTGMAEDFYESTFTNGEWTVATPLAGDINTTDNEGAQNLSADGKWLVFAGCEYPGGLGSCDLYISIFKDNKWSRAYNLEAPINTEFWESAPSLSPDKQDLYFVSNRPGGFGGRDLYVVHMAPNGEWGAPVNLGPGINTAADEESPFMHADNQTLYFSSNGHPGYGGKDLFFVKKDSTGRFGKPVNLGYPINTISEEASLAVAADGVTAYYASDAANGGLDIFYFKLNPENAAARTIWVSGNVFDKNTKEPLAADIDLINLAGNKKVATAHSDAKGHYLVTLPTGQDYALKIDRKGYLFYSDNFSLKQNKNDSAKNIMVYLQPIQKGANIVVKNIFFDSKQFSLKPESGYELDNIIALLNENPAVHLEIAGHTDNVGKPADNLSLSQQRAKSVMQYLVSKGIAANRLTAKGFGETKPVADNNSDKGRAANRRTEITVL